MFPQSPLQTTVYWISALATALLLGGAVASTLGDGRTAYQSSPHVHTPDFGSADWPFPPETREAKRDQATHYGS